MNGISAHNLLHLVIASVKLKMACKVKSLSVASYVCLNRIKWLLLYHELQLPTTQLFTILVFHWKWWFHWDACILFRPLVNIAFSMLLLLKIKLILDSTKFNLCYLITWRNTSHASLSFSSHAFDCIGLKKLEIKENRLG